MKDYTQSITPDSFSGIIFALEGIANTVVLLNGPTGCKFYHAAVSENITMKPFEFDPLNYPEKWFFGQPRVPCTYLDSTDYIYGSKDKLREALTYLSGHVSFDLLAIVNSPGAALIGDDLRGIAADTLKEKPFVIMETPGFSENICSGYETGMLSLLQQLAPRSAARKRKRTANILGLSIYHRNHLGDIAELKRLFALCGVEINCFLGADCTLKSIEKLPDSTVNVVIHPEYGLKTANYLKERYGTPFYLCEGPPIGFEATEKMMTEICGLLNLPCHKLTEASEKARATAYLYISRMYSLTGLPKGALFAVEGTYSELYAYSAFLIKHFGMIPACLSPLNQKTSCFQEKTESFLDAFGLRDVLAVNILHCENALVFASGSTIAKLKLKRHPFVGVEIALPSLGYVDVMPKTHLGLTGALLLTEHVINGMTQA